MPIAEFETALSAEGWSQQEMDDLRAMLNEIERPMREVHRAAKLDLSAALSRWNGGGSAKLATLGAAFAIPNPTDLSGTGDVVKENLSDNIMAYVTTVQALGTQAHTDNLLPLLGSVNV